MEESNSRYQFQQLQSNSGLLRFLSAASSSVRPSFKQGDQPAHSFSNNIISFQNGYDTMKGIEIYDGMNDNDGELSLSMNTLKNQGGSNVDARYYDPNKFPYDSHDQNGELRNQIHTLSHQLSLPIKSSEMFVMDNLFQFHDSVPSIIRAKRGFATHPRSIAERVRRTRISERIRKLQELVPNIDKQTNTADMLELSLEYIKDLQKQLKTLNAKRAKCRCIRKQKSEMDQIA